MFGWGDIPHPEVRGVNSLFLSYLLEFCMVLGVRCVVDIFKLTASAQSIYREVYARELTEERSTT